MLGQTSWIFLKTVIQSPLNPFQGRAPMSLSFYVKLPPAPTDSKYSGQDIPTSFWNLSSSKPHFVIKCCSTVWPRIVIIILGIKRVSFPLPSDYSKRGSATPWSYCFSSLFYLCFSQYLHHFYLKFCHII